MKERLLNSGAVGIPEGRECTEECPFWACEFAICRLFCQYSGGARFKIDKCIKQFGEGGIFVLVKKEVKE